MEKILIIIPCFQYPTPECMESIFSTISTHGERYDIRVRFVVGYAVDMARNQALQLFLQSDAEYLWFVDSDIVVQEDTLKRLIESGADVTTAVYYKKSVAERKAEIYKVEDDKLVNYSSEEMPEELFKVQACGFGCVLLKREVVEKVADQTDIPFDYHKENGLVVSEDIWFCMILMKLGIDIYCDPLASVYHVGKFLF